MEKQTIITITGRPGSGKSTIAKRLADSLNYEYFSAGDMVRRMAEERGLTLKEMNLTAEEQEEIDYQIDDYLKQMTIDGGELVVDARLGFHWMSQSFKIFLDVTEQIAARRIFDDIQKEVRSRQYAATLEEAAENTKIREESEWKRFKRLYNIDYYDLSQYNCVVDTSIHGVEEAVSMIGKTYRHWLNTPE